MEYSIFKEEWTTNELQHGLISQTLWEVKEARHGGIYPIIPFTWHSLKMQKLLGQRSLPVAREGDWMQGRKERKFEDDRNTLYLDCSGGCKTHMCQNTSNCTVQRVNFTVCKLYFNKLHLQKVCRLLKDFNIYGQIALPLT